MSDLGQETIAVDSGQVRAAHARSTGLIFMGGKNDKTPQGELERLVAHSLQWADQTIARMDKPPVATFLPSVVLQAVRDKLSDHRAGQINKGEFTVLTQLINNEVKIIDECLQTGCIVKSAALLEGYREHNSIAKPGVVLSSKAPSRAHL